MRRLAEHRAAAYTLLEVLVVVVLMGLVTASIVPRIGLASARADHARLVHDLVELDRAARMSARQGHWCMVDWQAEERRMRLVQGLAEPRIGRTVEIGERIVIETIGFDEPVVFDAFGQSRDYGYRVLAEQRVIAELRFNGRSGWYEVR